MLSLGKGLLFCSGCDDNFTVTVKTVDNKNDATGDPNDDKNEGCGASYACVKPVSGSGGAPPGLGVHVGAHMGNMFMVFEDPPKSAAQDKMKVWHHTEWKWTADISKVGQPVPCLEEALDVLEEADHLRDGSPVVNQYH